MDSWKVPVEGETLSELMGPLEGHSKGNSEGVS